MVLGSSVAEKYTACVFRRLSLDRGSNVYPEQYPYQMIWCICGRTKFQCFSDSFYVVARRLLNFFLKKLLFVHFFHVIRYHVIQFSLVCRQTNILYFQAHKTHRDFSVRKFRKKRMYFNFSTVFPGP